MPLQLGKGIACRAAKTNFGKAPFLYKGRHPFCIREDMFPLSGKTPFPQTERQPFQHTEKAPSQPKPERGS